MHFLQIFLAETSSCSQDLSHRREEINAKTRRLSAAKPQPNEGKRYRRIAKLGV
jgi:hypothetical protein